MKIVRNLKLNIRKAEMLLMEQNKIWSCPY